MEIRGIDHVQLAMPAGGEDRARSFYRDLLELEEVPKPSSLAGRGGAWFQRRDVKIHLGVEDNFRPAQKAHPAFLVSDLSGLIKRCRRAGYPVDDSQPPLPGFRRVHIRDPFGNRIELMELA